MTNAFLWGRPDAGNPHVWLDEGEVAMAKSRRGSPSCKKQVFMAGLAMAAVCVFGVQVPEEEEFGQRVYFINGDKFETGNYRDYFMRSFSGELKRNQMGYEGYVCDIAFADSRPFRIEGGKKYVLRMKVFNKGDAKDKLFRPPAKGCTFPSNFFFLRDDWKEIGVLRARAGNGSKGGIEGAFVDAPPAVGKWIDCAFRFVAPEGAKMFMFSVAYGNGTEWGCYLLADVRLEEEK